MKLFAHTVLFLITLIPSAASAQIIITEIMYNPEGTDSGFEWIEVYNSGDSDIDITAYKLFENDVNHKIAVIDGGQNVLPPNQFAIIADNVDKFLSANSFSGQVFDSAFSLNNSGETISIVDVENNVIHSVTYSSDWGGNGTGNSLQNNDEIWIAAKPTIGEVNSSTPANEESQTDTNSDTNSSSSSNSNTKSDAESAHSGQSDLTYFKKETPLEIGLGRNRYVTINSPLKFSSVDNQDSGRKLNYLWSFGDATMKKGSKVTHTYYTPGDYNVVLNASNGKEQAVSRVKVTVREPKLNIDVTTRGKLVDIMLENLSGFEVNFGGYAVEILGNTEASSIGKFTIPEDTIVSDKQKLSLVSEITGFILPYEEYRFGYDISYPNGVMVEQQTYEQLYLVEKLAPFLLPEQINDLNTIFQGP